MQLRWQTADAPIHPPFSHQYHKLSFDHQASSIDHHSQVQPVAIVAFLGRDHVYAKTGRAAGAGLARSLSICQWVLVPVRHEVVVVPDALLDGRCARMDTTWRCADLLSHSPLVSSLAQGNLWTLSAPHRQLALLAAAW